MYDVITFGSATFDMFAETIGEHIVREADENYVAYRSGDKIPITELHSEIGGGGTNTAACLNKLGLRVGYAGSIGKDKHGDDVLRWLSNNGIAFLGSQVQEMTDTSVILDSKQLDDRTILNYKGASAHLNTHDLHIENLKATWFCFSTHTGESVDAMHDLMRHANANGIAVAFNPGSFQTQGGLEGLQEALSLSQLFMCNKGEAEMLVGEGSTQELCRKLRDAGGEIVIVTNGSHGASVLYHDTIYSSHPIPDREVIETTGAGDCFFSTFVAGLDLGLKPEQCLRLSFLNSESLIRSVGAKNGLLTKDEALEALASDNREIHQQKL